MSNKRAPRKSRKPKSTYGRDDETAKSSRSDYYVSGALELTPHRTQMLKAALRQPIMDRRLKYSIQESSLVASNATSATPNNLVSINQGTTDITRTGDRVRVKRIWFSAWALGSAGSSVPALTRVILVCWNPVGNAAVNAPIASQIIQHSAGYGPVGSYSRDFGDSYQVIYDSVASVQPNNAAGAELELYFQDRKVLIDMEFIAGATVPATNGIYLFALTNTATFQPTIYYSSTIWYEDLDA